MRRGIEYMNSEWKSRNGILKFDSIRSTELLGFSNKENRFFSRYLICIMYYIPSLDQHTLVIKYVGLKMVHKESYGTVVRDFESEAKTR